VPVDAPRDAGRGLVLIFFAEQRSFSDDDLELARHLADATRGALERSELFEAERGARALAQQLTRTGRLLASELDPAAVLDEVVQQAPARVHAEAGAFRMHAADELVVTAVAGDGAEAAHCSPWPRARRRHFRTRSCTSASRSSGNGRSPSSPTSPRGSWPSTATARSCSGTAPPKRSPAFPRLSRRAVRPSTCCSGASSRR